MQSIRLAAPLQYDSTVDGVGLRMVLWTQGCIHHCRNCHNPNTWDLNGGYLESIENINKAIEKGFYHDGLTLSGGEPLLQCDALIPVVLKAKSMGLNIWCYTGFKYEDIVNTKMFELVKLCDVLVDGKFEEDKKSLSLRFKGSSNQRIIDIKESIKQKRIILLRV